MPHVDVDGVKLYYEETGEGTPLLFLHEFAGDHRSWEAQVGAFARDHRCVVVANRGYPPSDAPEAAEAYDQAIINRDAIAVMDAAGIDKAHVIGLSMGAYTALQLALEFPERLLSAVVASGGSGSYQPTRDEFVAEVLVAADHMAEAGEIPAEAFGLGATRVQLLVKDPPAWRLFVERLAEHPARPAAQILRQIQVKRPSLYDQEEGLRAVETPVLLVVGDEDDSCLDVNLFLKRIMPSAQLAMLPGCGHALNLEEPRLFADTVGRFLSSVDRGTWRPRDPRARGDVHTALGMGGRESDG